MASKFDQSPSKEIICSNCKKPFLINCIKKHLTNKQICKDKYSNDDLEKLNKICFDYQKIRKSMNNKEFYQKNKEIIAKKNTTIEKKKSKKLYNRSYYKIRKVDLSSKFNCHCCGRSFSHTGIKIHLQKDIDCIEYYQANKDIAHLLSRYVDDTKKRQEKTLELWKKSKHQFKVQDSIAKYSPSLQMTCRGCNKVFDKKDMRSHLSDNRRCSFSYSSLDSIKMFRKFEKGYINTKCTVVCKCCKVVFPLSSIKIHLFRNQDCKGQYSKSEYSELLASCESDRKERKSDQYYLKERQKEYERQYAKYCCELPDTIDYWHDNVSYKLKISWTLNSNMGRIEDLKELGTCDPNIDQELKAIKIKMKTKLKELKLELADLLQELDDMTGEWISEDPKNLAILEKEARMDINYATDMLLCFESHAKCEMRQLDKSIWSRLLEISDKIGYVHTFSNEKAKAKSEKSKVKMAQTEG